MNEADAGKFHEQAAGLFRYGCVGQCVSSVAHDVNNYIGAILAYSELLEQDAELSDENRRMLRNIQENVKRASDAIKTLTMVARKEHPDKSVIDPALFVDEVLNLKRYDFKMGRVTLNFAGTPGLPNVMVDRPKLAMALLYVLFNAYEAVAGRPGAQISVSVAHADGCTEIAVDNSGERILEPECERIFEPFSSSKDGHLGLGLALARAIMREQGGDLMYQPERGFVFRLKAPTAA